MTDSLQRSLVRRLLAPLALALVCSGAAAQPQPRAADFIVAVVNQDLVTAGEVDMRVARARDEMRRAGQPVPDDATLRRQALDSLIDERVIVAHARDSGVRLDDAEVERAVAGIAAQNRLTVPQLREQLQRDGIDYARFRSELRDQLLAERARDREMQARVKVSEREIEEFLSDQRRAQSPSTILNLAQILVPVAEGASAQEEAAARATAQQALERVQAGAAFAAVAREVSQDANKERGGEIGARPAERLPDLFVDAVKGLRSGAVAPALLRSGAGFHVLKVIERQEGINFLVTRTRARHILLRPSPEGGVDAAKARLTQWRREIGAGRARFEDLARANSADGSAAQGGDLGWSTPGVYVPEFEEALERLAVGQMSDPVVTRFGVHLIQVVERRDEPVDAKQMREQARAVLRARRAEAAYAEWVAELRSRAYVEMRERP